MEVRLEFVDEWSNARRMEEGVRSMLKESELNTCENELAY